MELEMPKPLTTKVDDLEGRIVRAENLINDLLKKQDSNEEKIVQLMDHVDYLNELQNNQL